MKFIAFLLLSLMIPNFIFSQNITNTLGTNGVFSIKDNTTTFFSLYQDDGRISLADLQGSTLGFIYKNSSLFLHNYSPIGTDGCNTFIGVNAGNTSMNGTGGEFSSNTAVGFSSMYSLTTGGGNTAMGDYTLSRNTTGGGNTAIGSSALSSCIECYSNIAVGYRALNENLDGIGNTAVGFLTLRDNVTGYSNTGVGTNALLNNNDGYENTALGGLALSSNISGLRNTAIGFLSMDENTEGNDNTTVGLGSLWQNISGDENTALGTNTGSSITSGNNNTLVGYDAQPSSGNVDNEVVLGNGSVNVLRCNVLEITTLSDIRDKKNIEDLTFGLDFILKLKPRQFNWDKREWYQQNESDGSKIENKLTAGFIAQELDEAQQNYNAEWLNLVYKSNPDKLEATPGNLLPILVKAIQELKQENDNLKQELQSLIDLKEQMNSLSELISELNIKITTNSGIVSTDTK